jgi:hypothetical protein
MNFDPNKDKAASRLDREADALLENAKLREETKEYLDETLLRRFRPFSVEEENEYLRETLAWESAPILSIENWLSPSWSPLDVSTASESTIAAALLDLLERLRSLHQEIWRADHLSNRRLYQLIVKWVLPDKQKRLPAPPCPTVWTFEFFTEDQELDDADDTIWLTYYATSEERRHWSQDRNATPPPRLTPPYAGRFASLNGGCGRESVD